MTALRTVAIVIAVLVVVVAGFAAVVYHAFRDMETDPFAPDPRGSARPAGRSGTPAPAQDSPPRRRGGHDRHPQERH